MQNILGKALVATSALAMVASSTLAINTTLPVINGNVTIDVTDPSTKYDNIQLKLRTQDASQYTYNLVLTNPVLSSENNFRKRFEVESRNISTNKTGKRDFKILTTVGDATAASKIKVKLIQQNSDATNTIIYDGSLSQLAGQTKSGFIVGQSAGNALLIELSSNVDVSTLTSDVTTSISFQVVQ